LLRSFHELSDKLAIKEKILESLTEQLATEAKSAASLGAEVRALKKSQTELERRVADADEARRAMQQELRELQEEAMEWANFEDEQDRARTTIDALKADNEKLQKQLVSWTEQASPCCGRMYAAERFLIDCPLFCLCSSSISLRSKRVCRTSRAKSWA